MENFSLNETKYDNHRKRISEQNDSLINNFDKYTNLFDNILDNQIERESTDDFEQKINKELEPTENSENYDSESEIGNENTQNISNKENILEMDLKDMIRVFMEQNAQFDFLNKFYENSDESEINDIDNIKSDLCITEYNIYIWKNIEINKEKNKIHNVISIAPNKYDAINIIKKRYFTTMNQVKTHKKNLFCNSNFEYNTDNCKKFINQLQSTKCFVFPCKNFGCFY